LRVLKGSPRILPQNLFFASAQGGRTHGAQEKSVFSSFLPAQKRGCHRLRRAAPDETFFHPAAIFSAPFRIGQ